MRKTIINDYAALIGVDWADKKHDVWVYNCDNANESHNVIENTPECLTEWINELHDTYNGATVAIALEQSKGSLMYALSGHSFIHLYIINPASLAKYRQTFYPSHSKDDPMDARLLMDLLLKHGEQFKRWKPDDEETRKITLLNAERRKSINMRTKLVQRLQSALKSYYPQFLDLVTSTPTTEMACAFILKWPTLKSLQRAKPQTIRSFLYRHNFRCTKRIEKLIADIRTATPLTKDNAIISVLSMTAESLAQEIRAVNNSIEKYDNAIDKLYRQHPDAFIFNSLPGAGKVLAPRLLATFGTDRNRFSCASDIQAYSGIAPVVERSGNQEWIHWRWNANTFVRQSFQEFANASKRFSLWAKAYYQLQLERGKSHHAAVRALAFKWQRIIFRCWKNKISYDEDLYIQSLKQNGSPLWSYIQNIQNA